MISPHPQKAGPKLIAYYASIKLNNKMAITIITGGEGNKENKQETHSAWFSHKIQKSMQVTIRNLIKM